MLECCAKDSSGEVIKTRRRELSIFESDCLCPQNHDHNIAFGIQNSFRLLSAKQGTLCISHAVAFLLMSTTTIAAQTEFSWQVEHENSFCIFITNAVVGGMFCLCKSNLTACSLEVVQLEVEQWKTGSRMFHYGLSNPPPPPPPPLTI